MDQTLYTRLSGDATLAGIVSTRIYPVEPSNNTAVPFVVYTRSDTEDFVNLTGSDGLAKHTFQLDYWAINLDTAQSVTAALYTLLHCWSESGVQGCFRVAHSHVEEEFRNGTAFHGQSVYAIFG